MIVFFSSTFEPSFTDYTRPTLISTEINSSVRDLYCFRLIIFARLNANLPYLMYYLPTLTEILHEKISNRGWGGDVSVIKFKRVSLKGLVISFVSIFINNNKHFILNIPRANFTKYSCLREHVLAHRILFTLIFTCVFPPIF